MSGFTDTAFSEHMKNPEIKEQLQKAGEKLAMSPDAVARAVAYVFEQPEGINAGEVTLRSKAQPYDKSRSGGVTRNAHAAKKDSGFAQNREITRQR